MNEKAKESHRKASRKYNETKEGKETRKKAYQKYRSTNKHLNKTLQRMYGITLSQWQEMFEKQKGCCAICGTHQVELKITLNVDHCHETDKVRGLLCSGCNKALGLIKTNVRTAKGMVKYIDNCC